MESVNLATVQQAKDMGLLESEFEKIKEILGRTPNFCELSIYGVMWSEHCSYKNSILWLKNYQRWTSYARKSWGGKCWVS